MNIVWLRRDLRLHDHAALHMALEEKGPIQPIFIFDTEILARFDNKRDHRLAFIADALIQLNTELKKRGGQLWVFHGKPIDIVPKLGGKVFAAEDFEPATILRDREVAKKCDLTLVLDHLMAHPKQITKDDGTPYKVFTPFSKAWYEQLNDGWFAERRINDKGRYRDAKSPLPTLSLESAEKLLSQVGYTYAPLKEWPAEKGRERLAYFEQGILNGYAETRDIPGIDGTSRISPYLRFGLVSIRECYRAAALHLGSDALTRKDFGPRTQGARKWVAELIWRDFYAMILYRFPDSATKEFQEQYRDIKWSYDKAHIKAWKEGKTGYPIVDAAMRQLLTEGWMHNRARMIVASFLTKHLQVDWRIGEEHFAQHLMDYEMASNVGGWQWAASTGTDAQPYFRVFNPTLQSEKFDPAGNYIHHFVPELKSVLGKDIHSPEDNLLKGTYPPPVVDHSKARNAAIALFKKA